MTHLKTFHLDMLHLVDQFHDYWKQQNEISPKDYPVQLDEADWFEQFIVWVNQKDTIE